MAVIDTVPLAQEASRVRLPNAAPSAIFGLHEVRGGGVALLCLAFVRSSRKRQRQRPIGYRVVAQVTSGVSKTLVRAPRESWTPVAADGDHLFHGIVILLTFRLKTGACRRTLSGL